MCVLLISVLFLVSCQPRAAAGENPRETSAILQQVQSGTQGIEMKFVQNYPPQTIYDQMEMIALVELWNRGTHDLSPGECFIQATGFDPDIIEDIDLPQDCTSNVGGVLEGKNEFNTEGGFSQLEFNSPRVELPDGVFQYNPTLDMKACYRYRTRANPQVCVDPQIYQINSEQKTCQVQDVSTGGGQGGPVGVSHVGVTMVGNKAVYEISIQNYGTGTVLSPDVNVYNCDVDYRDVDKVEFDVTLGGAAARVNCNPLDEIVRLVNKQGKIVCTFEVPNTAPYEAPLQIDLNYAYLDSVKQPISIVKLPGE